MPHVKFLLRALQDEEELPAHTREEFKREISLL